MKSPCGVHPITLKPARVLRTCSCTCTKRKRRTSIEQSARKQPAPIPVPRGKEGTPRVLVFSSPCGGNSPITRLLDQNLFQTSYIVPDFYDQAAPLPPHDLVVNAVGDADQCGTSLEALPPLLAQTSKPVINRPECVQATGRADNARLLGELEGVITPRIVSLSRETLAGPDGVSLVEQHGFSIPRLAAEPRFPRRLSFLARGKAGGTCRDRHASSRPEPDGD